MANDQTTRICLWSGPRNISTALMYSFAQRSDTAVFDEPLYAHYLTHSNAHEYHPGSADVIATQDNNGMNVINNLVLGEHDKPVLFFKHMTHHLVELDWAFMDQTVNVFLTRNPEEMLPSYAKQVKQPALHDTGYPQHHELLQYLRDRGQNPPILDSTETLKNPRKVLTELCDHIGIPFDEAMLSWEAGARPEDGSWAQYWYASVHQSTGFLPYAPKETVFPEELRPLLAECQPYYEELAAQAIKA